MQACIKYKKLGSTYLRVITKTYPVSKDEELMNKTAKFEIIGMQVQKFPKLH
jgi:hypothetical protein